MIETAKDSGQVLTAWLEEAETKLGLQRCADAGINALHRDLTLRVPRSSDLRVNQFAAWRTQWKRKLAVAMQEEFARQFPGVAKDLEPGTISQIVTDYVWPGIEAELLDYAVEALALKWVRRHMGDATILRRPELIGQYWMVPLGIAGHDGNFGQVILDTEGNVIEERSSSRQEMLESIHR